VLHYCWVSIPAVDYSNIRSTSEIYVHKRVECDFFWPVPLQGFFESFSRCIFDIYNNNYLNPKLNSTKSTTSNVQIEIKQVKVIHESSTLILRPCNRQFLNCRTFIIHSRLSWLFVYHHGHFDLYCRSHNVNILFELLWSLHICRK